MTHCHPDHLGLAAWLEQETGAPLWIAQGEYLAAHMMAEQIAGYAIPSMVEFFRRHGLEFDALLVRGLGMIAESGGEVFPANDLLVPPRP